MPRVSALRIAALADLAKQLRYAPRATLRRQLTSAERLASEIDPEANYPEDWVVRRLTGYRPDMANPAVFVGVALLADLSAFVELVSEEARFSVEDLGDEPISVEELSRRWSVSRKTIERWRRQGLIAYRVRDQRGRVRLSFPARCVNAFERRRPDELARAHRFNRGRAEAQRRLVRLAERCHRRFGWSLNQTALRLADRSDQSHETVRRLLRRHDERAATPIFAEAGPLPPRRRAALYRASRAGATINRLAAWCDRSPATVRRMINQHRLDLLRGLDLSGSASSAFSEPDAEQKILAPDVVRSGLGVRGAQTAGEFIERARAAGPPDAATERALASAAHFLQWRAATIVGEARRESPIAKALDRAETDLRWVALLRAGLVAAQRRLAIETIESRLGHSLLELSADDLCAVHATAMGALIAAARAYDPFRGGRLASPAGLAVDRAVAAWLRSLPDRAMSHSRPRARSSGVRLDDWTPRVAPWRAWLDPDPRLVRRLDDLPELTRAIIAERYGLLGGAPNTLEALQSRHGLTSARLASIEREALPRVRGKG